MTSTASLAATSLATPNPKIAMGWLHTAKFLTTAPELKHLPRIDVPEIAFVGRSNAGKSTCINTLTQQHRLAFASKTPGRTQSINLFSLGKQAVTDLRPHGYIGTPSFLKILVEKAEETSTDIRSLRKGMVGGEAFPPSLRDWLTARGLDVYQSYATADAGLIAYETASREGLVLDEAILLEIVRPGTGDPVPDGEVGEVVVTVLNPDYPLVRFGTGDLSAVLAGRCPTGRSNTRIQGWMGRADQTTKVRGMFVHPSQVAEVARRHPEIVKARLVVEGEMANDRMTLRVEAADPPDALGAAVAASVRDVTKLRAEVVISAPGTLPNDGKVIEDARSYR